MPIPRQKSASQRLEILTEEREGGRGKEGRKEIKNSLIPFQTQIEKHLHIPPLAQIPPVDKSTFLTPLLSPRPIISVVVSFNGRLTPRDLQDVVGAHDQNG